MLVVTSGHCTYVNNNYAKKILVTFPNQGTVTAFAKDLYASPEYIATGNPDFDYGLILLAGNSDDGFGWTSIIQDSELDARLVTNCGYPGDKPRAILWITGGPIHSFTPKRIYYMNDTAGGQSGSPVYTWCGGYWTVLGVHSYWLSQLSG
ncbi:Extracellular metalloprotease [Oopsacas minuta]|uniref:Serine protease n=1 Tax=Oopsacas minuta TaxID=111878 RepID=A0AAV7JHZ5_9METZ|nr:Extracellular metalloprotease [Oopsacas minuta]